MTDKEFKRLNRSQLIDIIFQLQLKHDELAAENENLTQALADKRLRINKAGNIAEAALELNNVMQSAQNAAALYLEEIQIMREETREECERILAQAHKEAEDIVDRARKAQPGVSAKPKTSKKKKHKKKKSAGGRK